MSEKTIEWTEDKVEGFFMATAGGKIIDGPFYLEDSNEYEMVLKGANLYEKSYYRISAYFEIRDVMGYGNDELHVLIKPQ